MLPSACERSAPVAFPFSKNIERLRPSGRVIETVTVPLESRATPNEHCPIGCPFAWAHGIFPVASNLPCPALTAEFSVDSSSTWALDSLADSVASDISAVSFHLYYSNVATLPLSVTVYIKINAISGVISFYLKLISDNSSQPTSLNFMKVCFNLGIQQIFTSYNNPKGSADTEKMIRTMKEELL